MNAGEQLAKNIRELQERNKGRKVWSVKFDDLVDHIFCSTEKYEHKIGRATSELQSRI